MDMYQVAIHGTDVESLRPMTPEQRLQAIAAWMAGLTPPQGEETFTSLASLAKTPQEAMAMLLLFYHDTLVARVLDDEAIARATGGMIQEIYADSDDIQWFLDPQGPPPAHAVRHPVLERASTSARSRLIARGIANAVNHGDLDTARLFLERVQASPDEELESLAVALSREQAWSHVQQLDVQLMGRILRVVLGNEHVIRLCANFGYFHPLFLTSKRLMRDNPTLCNIIRKFAPNAPDEARPLWIKAAQLAGKEAVLALTRVFGYDPSLIMEAQKGKYVEEALAAIEMSNTLHTVEDIRRLPDVIWTMARQVGHAQALMSRAYQTGHLGEYAALVWQQLDDKEKKFIAACIEHLSRDQIIALFRVPFESYAQEDHLRALLQRIDTYASEEVRALVSALMERQVAFPESMRTPFISAVRACLYASPHAKVICMAGLGLDEQEDLSPDEAIAVAREARLMNRPLHEDEVRRLLTILLRQDWEQAVQSLVDATRFIGWNPDVHQQIMRNPTPDICKNYVIALQSEGWNRMPPFEQFRVFGVMFRDTGKRKDLLRLVEVCGGDVIRHAGVHTPTEARRLFSMEMLAAALSKHGPISPEWRDFLAQGTLRNRISIDSMVGRIGHHPELLEKSRTEDTAYFLALNRHRCWAASCFELPQARMFALLLEQQGERLEVAEMADDSPSGRLFLALLNPMYAAALIAAGKLEPIQRQAVYSVYGAIADVQANQYIVPDQNFALVIDDIMSNGGAPIAVKAAFRACYPFCERVMSEDLDQNADAFVHLGRAILNGFPTGIANDIIRSGTLFVDGGAPAVTLASRVGRHPLMDQMFQSLSSSTFALYQRACDEASQKYGRPAFGSSQELGENAGSLIEQIRRVVGRK